MRRYLLPALLLIALGWNAALFTASQATQAAATQPASYLPVVMRDVKLQSTGTSMTTLIDHDTTFVTASVEPSSCRVFVTYIDRANGNRLHVTEDMFNRLVEVTMPISAALELGIDYIDPQPSFVFPGPKHASGFALPVCGELWVYANARDVGDLTGPFKLKRYTMPMPPRPPVN